MTTDELLQLLRHEDTLLPQEILKDSNTASLVIELKAIFETNQTELEENVKFRANFTELVNYIYLTTLSQKPAQRNKNLFSSQLIAFLLSSNPQAA